MDFSYSMLLIGVLAVAATLVGAGISLISKNYQDEEKAGLV